jgi:hypothetical protein
MHVDAKGAAVDLGSTQLDQFDQRFLQAAAADVSFDPADGAIRIWYDFGQGPVGLGHDKLLRLRLAEKTGLVA